METYKYKAITENGEVLEGFYNAQSEQEVLSMIKSNGYYPVKIEESIEKESVSSTIQSKVKKKDIAVFCRQFYTMLDAGISIVKCLEILEEQTENKGLKRGIKSVYEDVQKGLSLSEAMKKQKKVFPELLVSMVGAGEVSGNLDVIMERMAVHYEKENNIDNKVKNAFTYPLILIIVSISVVIFLLVYVMPTFIDMFEASDMTLPAPTRVLLNISNWLKNYWYVLIGIIIGIIAFINIYGKSNTGRMFFDTIKIKFPGIKKTNIKILTSRFTRTLSTLLSSGIPLIQSLEVVSRVVGNKVIVKGLDAAEDDIRKGVPLSQTVRSIGIFPPMLDSMIAVGEESGSLDEMLNKTADFYDEEVEVSLEKMTTMMEPILIIIMAFIIGFIVIAMAMPMFDMVNTVDM